MDRLPVSFGGTAASSAGQDVVNAKLDIGFRPTARRYERVQLLISTDEGLATGSAGRYNRGRRSFQRPPQQQTGSNRGLTGGTGAELETSDTSCQPSVTILATRSCTRVSARAPDSDHPQAPQRRQAQWPV